MPSDEPSRKNTRTVLIILCLLLVVIIGAATGAFLLFKKEISGIKTSQTEQHKNAIRTNQFLLSTLDWSTRRQRLILFMRDRIIHERLDAKVPITLDKAYLYAEHNMIESEKYQHIDPLFLLAIQRRESFFSDSIVSERGAIGLMQIMPSTGRLVCGFFGISYRIKLLYNPKVNIQLGAKLVDVLYATYDDYELVLADYNGGPYSAYYFKTKDKRLAKETKEYVPYIMKKWSEYKMQLSTFKIDSIYLAYSNDYNNIIMDKKGE